MTSKYAHNIIIIHFAYHVILFLRNTNKTIHLSYNTICIFKQKIDFSQSNIDIIIILLT